MQSTTIPVSMKYICDVHVKWWAFSKVKKKEDPYPCRCCCMCILAMLLVLYFSCAMHIIWLFCYYCCCWTLFWHVILLLLLIKYICMHTIVVIKLFYSFESENFKILLHSIFYVWHSRHVSAYMHKCNPLCTFAFKNI